MEMTVHLLRRSFPALHSRSGNELRGRYHLGIQFHHRLHFPNSLDRIPSSRFVADFFFLRISLTSRRPIGAFGWYAAWNVVGWCLILLFVPEVSRNILSRSNFVDVFLTFSL